MQINTYNNRPIESNNLSFKTTYKKVISKVKPFSFGHENSTSSFVSDFEWDKFFDRVKEKNIFYNFFSLASSDCSEAYSIALMLKTKFGDLANNFPKIKAVDFDANVLELSQKGYIDLSLEDEMKINKLTGNKLSKYFERTEIKNLTDTIGSSDRRELLTRFKISPELRNMVEIIHADVNEYIPTMPDKDNIIFCRNCWVYFNQSADSIAQKLASKMDKNSFLAIGNYDSIFCPMNTKNCYNLHMDKDLHNVFTTNDSNYFDIFRPIMSKTFDFYGLDFNFLRRIRK